MSFIAGVFLGIIIGSFVMAKGLKHYHQNECRGCDKIRSMSNVLIEIIELAKHGNAGIIEKARAVLKYISENK